MVETRNGLRYVPDYRMPTEEVYTKVARLLIEDDGHLQILSDAQGLKHNPELPSWVPDWRGESLVKPLAERTRTFTQTYRIHGNFEPSEIITPHSDDRMLKLHGAALGKIKLLIALDELRAALCSQDIQLDNWSRLLSLPRQFFEMCNAVGLGGPSTYGPTNEPKSIAFIKTLAADRLPCSSRLTPSDVEEFFPWYSDYDSLTWREALRPLALPTSAMDDSSHADVAGGPSREVIGVLLGTVQPTRWNFGSSNILEKLKVATVYRNIADDVINAVISKLSQRAMFVTDTGYMGIGPANATTGDEVYDLMGGDVPFVLRPTSGENEFGLLGDCYVHGVMDGQLWRPNADGTWLESVDGSLEWRAVTLI
ncbi:hypothetical protein GQ53DRAFT_752968 [Thozetella sp. PMI_491]|nr:hypothetical protein GQ53DRAFT_752968 [Thozetella sp. PMI_491]